MMDYAVGDYLAAGIFLVIGTIYLCFFLLEIYQAYRGVELDRRNNIFLFDLLFLDILAMFKRSDSEKIALRTALNNTFSRICFSCLVSAVSFSAAHGILFLQ